MIKRKIVEELERILNENIDTIMFPYQKGNSIRIGKMIVRRHSNGNYKVFDCKDNTLIATLFCKASAVALAKNFAKGNTSCRDKIVETDRRIEKNYNDSLFYKNTMDKTTDDVRYEIAEMRYDISVARTSEYKESLDAYIFS